MEVPSTTLAHIYSQLEKAQSMNYVTELCFKDAYIVVKFSPHVRASTVSLVLRFIQMKYGSHVWVLSGKEDPNVYEICDKNIAI